VSRWREVLRGAFGKGAFPHELWFLLELPGRRWVQPPAQLVERLQLTPSARVLEIGPGSGYYSVAVARAVPQGHLALLDLQPAFLARAQRKLAKAGLRHVSATPGDARKLPFPDASFDVVFFATVLGEIPDRPVCLREVFRVLAPGGRLSVTEQWPDPDFIPRDELERLVCDAGFEPERDFEGGRGYTANFRRPKEGAR
jgi:ubiquinone/menaquinone biosynthesis C-methylase UbiE